MAYLRIAAFDLPDPPDEAVDLWEHIMGSALRNHPECLLVMASRQNSRLAVISTWTSAGAFRDAAASKPIVDVHLTISARLNMPPDQEPVFLFEGEV
jgi:hypothetical protein